MKDTEVRKDARLFVRVPEPDLRRWKRMARREGLSFSEWLRKHLPQGDGPAGDRKAA